MRIVTVRCVGWRGWWNCTRRNHHGRVSHHEWWGRMHSTVRCIWCRTALWCLHIRVITWICECSGRCPVNSHKLLRMSTEVSIVHIKVSRDGTVGGWIVHPVDTRGYVIGRFSAPKSPAHNASGGSVKANITPAQFHTLTFSDSCVNAFW